MFILSCLFSLLSSPFSFRSSLRSFQRRGGFRVANWDPPRRCHSRAAPSRRVKSERLSSSRAQALYSDSKSHYYWDAKIKEIATSRKRATLQHFSSLLGPKPSETQGRLDMQNPVAHSTDPPLGTPEIEGCRSRVLSRRSRAHFWRFSALFSRLLCSSSSSLPVSVPFWPHFGALGTSKT